MKKKLFNLAEKLGFYIVPRKLMYGDIKDPEFWDIYNLCKPYTMTGIERMYSLFSAVKYIIENNIQGSFVECGVWRGGSAMLVAKMLTRRNITDRKIYLFDTFEGMSKPTKDDTDFTGKDAATLLKDNAGNKEESVWCLADLSDVQNNMRLTNFTSEKIIYVKGKVEETIPASNPAEQIALLRLDTDWYESTKHELIHLYPKLVKDGVLIIDDYGHWEGCRKAVDEYLTENNVNMFLSRIDYTGRIGIKSSNQKI
jgi:O-methyltransferase